MGNRHFVTILGTGNYSKCVYETEEGQFLEETPFVQIAVLNHVMAQYRPGDKITVFATKTAEEKNWNTTEAISAPGKAAETKVPGPETSNMHAPTANSIPPRRIHTYGKKTFRTLLLPNAGTANTAAKPDIPSQKSEPVLTSSPVKTVRIGLNALLQEKFPRAARQVVRIPEGRNKQELNKIFECIYEELSESEVVYFDFTHGLRNLPMQALAVVNYAKVLKKVTVGGLYYGAFELGRMDEAVNEAGLKCEKKHVPILDMSFCSTLQDWTSAAEAFVKAGSSNQIKSLYDGEAENPDETDSGALNTDAKYRDIVDSLYDLTNCLETSRGAIVYNPNQFKKKRKASSYAAYKYFQNSYKELNAEALSGVDQHKKRLIEYIYDDLKILDSKLILEQEGKAREMTHTAMGMATVKWAINKNLIQQGYTALNETLISYVCELFGIRTADYNEREYVRQTIGHVRLDNEWSIHAPTESEIKNRKDNWDKKWNKGWKDSYNGNDPDFPKTAHRILELPNPVFQLYESVRNDRNTLSHFSHQKDAELRYLSYETLRNNLSDRYGEMENIIRSNTDIDTSKYMSGGLL